MRLRTIECRVAYISAAECDESTMLQGLFACHTLRKSENHSSSSDRNRDSGTVEGVDASLSDPGESPICTFMELSSLQNPSDLKGPAYNSF